MTSCLPAGRSPRVSGVTPRAFPSTVTCAPAGVDSTFSEPVPLLASAFGAASFAVAAVRAVLGAADEGAGLDVDEPEKYAHANAPAPITAAATAMRASHVVPAVRGPVSEASSRLDATKGGGAA